MLQVWPTHTHSPSLPATHYNHKPLTGQPCHAPLELRWSCGSSSSMSPAYGGRDELFAWIGFIMYIPQSSSLAAAAVRAAFQELKLLLSPLMDKYKAREHWAKIEMDDIDRIRNRLSSLYPHWNEFVQLRAKSDPKGQQGLSGIRISLHSCCSTSQQAAMRLSSLTALPVGLLQNEFTNRMFGALPHGKL